MLVTASDLAIYIDVKFSLRQLDAAAFVLEGLQSELEAFLRRPVEFPVDEHGERILITEEHVIPSSFQGVPATSFFYDQSLDTTDSGLNYIQPSIVISLRSTPVVSISSVRIKSLGDSGTYLAEAMKRDATITGASQSGTIVTFTAANTFTKGQRVVVVGVTPDAYNKSSFEITAVTSTTFSVSGYQEGLPAYVSGGTVTATGNDYTVQRYGLEIYRGFPNDVIEVSYIGGLDPEAIKMFKLFILRAATREMQNMHDDVVGVKDLTTRNVAPLETGFSERELLALRRWRRRRI
jgi:hypothetical protein